MPQFDSLRAVRRTKCVRVCARARLNKCPSDSTFAYKTTHRHRDVAQTANIKANTSYAKEGDAHSNDEATTDSTAAVIIVLVVGDVVVVVAVRERERDRET